jgi:hypothetical protein
MTPARPVITVALVTVILVGAAQAGRSDLREPGRDWTASLNAYSWLNKYHLDINGLDVGSALDDLATGTNASFVAVGTLHWGQWALVVDGVFNNGDQTTTAGGTTVNLDISQIMIMPQLGYKLVDTRQPRGDGGQALWVNVGGRYWDSETRIDWTYVPGGSNPTPESGQINRNENWWDLLLGVSADFQFTEFVHGYVRGNVGGFGMSGSSDFTWDLSFLFAYHLSRTVGFHGGYQLLSFKRVTGEGATEVTTDQLTEGLFVGVGVVF